MHNEHQDQSKTKTFRFNNGKGFRITWGNITTIVALGVLIGGFFMDRGRRLEAFDNHQKEMVKMEARLKAVEKWQIDWPTDPEGLSLDGVQNNKLKEQARRIKVLEERMR